MSTKIRVCILIGSLAVGGAERQAVEILKRLDRRRFAPHLYVVYRLGELLEQVPDDVPMAAFSDEFPSPKRYFPGRILWCQARHLRRYLRQWQIDLLYDRTSQMSVTSYLAGRPHAMARVSVAAGDPLHEFRHAHARFALLKFWLLRRAYQDADRVVAVSDAVRQGLIRYFGLPPHQVETHYGLCDLAEMQSRSLSFTPERQAGVMYLVSVGRLQPEKGHRLLFEAIHHWMSRPDAPAVKLWCVGHGPEEHTLRQLVRAWRLESVVEFLGYQENPLPWVRHADVFCLPSLYEGMPNALVEALLLGTPIVATDCPGGVREVLDDGRWGTLVPAGDAQAMADALARVTQRLVEQRRQAQDAQRWAAARFDIHTHLHRLETMFEQLVEQRRVPSKSHRLQSPT